MQRNVRSHTVCYLRGYCDKKLLQIKKIYPLVVNGKSKQVLDSSHFRHCLNETYAESLV